VIAIASIDKAGRRALLLTGSAGMFLSLAYGLNTTCALLSFFFVLKFVPETKGQAAGGQA
jgi:hypothetical protein